METMPTYWFLLASVASNGRSAISMCVCVCFLACDFNTKVDCIVTLFVHIKSYIKLTRIGQVCLVTIRLLTLNI